MLFLYQKEFPGRYTVEDDVADAPLVLRSGAIARIVALQKVPKT